MSLSPHDHYRLTDYYERALKKFGERDARSVHWINLRNQQVRFEILAQVTDLNEKSVLDVGCGLGDLYTFFKERVISARYTGIDIVPEFIEIAEQHNPGARFLCKDIFDTIDQYDVVLASGALSFKVDNNQTYYQDMIKKMYDISKEAVAFNMLDDSLHINDDTYAAYSPHEIGDFCKTFSRRVEIVTGYLDHDFTIYLYK